MSTTMTNRPTWAEVWAQIGSEDMLAAKALIELSGDLSSEAVTWVAYDQRPVYSSDDWDAVQVGVEQGEPVFLYEEWIADVDKNGRGWCSSASRLFPIVAALLDPERTVNLRTTLGYGMGSWETEVWQILVNWGTGGNNREYPGRAKVVAR